ncbi:hypothetical protein [Calothrix sp. UHCC 0171]|uniref:hypothetical protein n=1 Tax=Calothrix sp. UHCC 0171 TaxID=3110245 RepID=UPI002B1E91EA|nr:hypothetical protein [Calothrix sp. UHCC 0171]MEA5571394.1 hypothetical protein [Calothrix sp. UHCC 0171]
MPIRVRRTQPPVRGVPRRRIPGGSRLRSVNLQFVLTDTSEEDSVNLQQRTIRRARRKSHNFKNI